MHLLICMKMFKARASMWSGDRHAGRLCDALSRDGRASLHDAIPGMHLRGESRRVTPLRVLLKSRCGASLRGLSRGSEGFNHSHRLVICLLVMTLPNWDLNVCELAKVCALLGRDGLPHLR